MITTMVESLDHSSYEEARRKRVEENQKKIQELGLLNISKDLKTASHRNSQTQNKTRSLKPKPENLYALQPRRSSRPRNPVTSYVDDVAVDLPPLRKRSRSSSSSNWASYLARPLHEVKTATFEERAAALRAAEKLQSELQSGNPSFVKSMVRSHVYSCFWLGLPSSFCEAHLSASQYNVVLETEDGAEYEAVYIGKRAGLSGGWRGFALEHKLDDGDAVVFEVIQPARFKVYIIRASALMNRGAVRKEGAKGAQKKTEQNLRRKVKTEDMNSISPQPKAMDKQEQAEDITSEATKAATAANDGGRRASTRNRRRRY